jgi:hypothetical protein
VRPLFPDERIQIEQAINATRPLLKDIQETITTMCKRSGQPEIANQLNDIIDKLSLALIQLGAEIGYGAGQVDINKSELISIITKGVDPHAELRKQFKLIRGSIDKE